MAVYDRWHRSRPRPDEPTCREHSKTPANDHGQGDRWQVRWRDDTGRQCKQNFAKRSDADSHDTTVRASLTSGTYVDAAAGRIRFRAFAEQWCAMQLHREATSVMIERALRLHINPVIGDLQLAAIRPAHIQQLVRQLADNLAPKTLRVTYGFVKSMFKSAVRDQLIGRSPCDAVRLAPLPRREVWIPDAAAVEAVAQALPKRYASVPRIAARTGLRPAELFGLEVGCVDFLRRTLYVRQQIATTAEGNVPYLASQRRQTACARSR